MVDNVLYRHQTTDTLQKTKEHILSYQPWQKRDRAQGPVGEHHLRSAGNASVHDSCYVSTTLIAFGLEQCMHYNERPDGPPRPNTSWILAVHVLLFQPCWWKPQPCATLTPSMPIPMEKSNQFIALKFKFSVVTSIDMLIAAQIVCY